MEALRERMKARAAAEVAGLVRRADTAVEGQDFGSARRLFEQMRSFNTAEAIAAAAEGEARMAKALKGAEERWAIDAVTQHVAILREVHKATAVRDYKQAVDPEGRFNAGKLLEGADLANAWTPSFSPIGAESAQSSVMSNTGPSSACSASALRMRRSPLQ